MTRKEKEIIKYVKGKKLKIKKKFVYKRFNFNHQNIIDI